MILKLLSKKVTEPIPFKSPFLGKDEASLSTKQADLLPVNHVEAHSDLISEMEGTSAKKDLKKNEFEESSFHELMKHIFQPEQHTYQELNSW